MHISNPFNFQPPAEIEPLRARRLRPRSGEACPWSCGRHTCARGQGAGARGCEWLFHVGNCGRQESISRQLTLSQFTKASICSQAGPGRPGAHPAGARNAPAPTGSESAAKGRETGKTREKEMLTHAPERPRNSVYALVMFLPFVVAKTCFYCIAETSSKSGNLRGIPVQISVGPQWREPQIQVRSQLAAGAESGYRRTVTGEGHRALSGEGPAS